MSKQKVTTHDLEEMAGSLAGIRGALAAAVDIACRGRVGFVYLSEAWRVREIVEHCGRLTEDVVTAVPERVNELREEGRFFPAAEFARFACVIEESDLAHIRGLLEQALPYVAHAYECEFADTTENARIATEMREAIEQLRNVAVPGVSD